MHDPKRVGRVSNHYMKETGHNDERERELPQKDCDPHYTCPVRLEALNFFAHG
jgi:hypothetical protein